jgi:hypothetical protein
MHHELIRIKLQHATNNLRSVQLAFFRLSLTECKYRADSATSVQCSYDYWTMDGATKYKEGGTLFAEGGHFSSYGYAMLAAYCGATSNGRVLSQLARFRIKVCVGKAPSDILAIVNTVSQYCKACDRGIPHKIQSGITSAHKNIRKISHPWFVMGCGASRGI